MARKRGGGTARELGATTLDSFAVSIVERLWRTTRFEEVCLRAYDTVSEARASLGRHIEFYNARRPHSSLDWQTPDRPCFNRQRPHL
jgi:transposase InsO family protein